MPQEELTSRPIRDLGDALQEVPGVATTIDKTGQSVISMRGLGSGYTLILIDGKRQNTSQGFGGRGIEPQSVFMPPVSMIERIEVIRGPASLLYGSDAMGGVINIITKKMPDKITGNVMTDMRIQEDNATWGNQYGANGYVNIPIIKNVFGINLRAAYKGGEQNSFWKRDVNGYDPQRESNNARNNPYISWSPTGYRTANIGTRLTYILDSKNSFYFDGELNWNLMGSMNTSGAAVTLVREFYKTNLILNHDGNYDFGKINTYMQYVNTLQLPHQLGTAANGTLGNIWLPIVWDTTATSAGQLNDPSRAFQQNDRLVLNSNWVNDYDLNTWGTIIANAGVYYEFESLRKKVTSEQMLSGTNLHQNLLAIFAEGEYIINDSISTNLGLRLNYLNLSNGRGNKFSPNPRFYVNYSPLDILTIKFGIASGFLTPNMALLYDGFSINSSGTTNTYNYGNINLQPENSWNYELSLISDTEYVFVSATGFYTDFINAIRSTSYSPGTLMPNGQTCNVGATTCSVSDNVDRAMSAGLELAANMKRILGIGFDTTYSFLHTEQLSGNSKGMPLNKVPAHTLTMKLSYKLNAFDIYLRYVGKFMTPTKTSVAQDREMEAIGQYFKPINLVDLGTSYKFDNKWTLNFMINNLFDQKFTDFIMYANPSNTLPNGQGIANRYQSLIPGRNYWVSVSLDF
ncbi:TonB-dependent receptor [Helicobacter saguini]|uniref:TonB-dependent receptor n=1 Tax=Helicobacter saguini TaxID=1548018 RepID=A0A347VS43_9HELI|nr:TonB-dependent receptor [Helicobacter saguini]MWV66670.1 TonB-dependent receptor [Helicobacter saguini]MWV69020.1 TonB-dependent receptor [Helicobacter saguini]MWV71426.1 TonB-dependent receptor [Helicobacter saguini]TLD94076.1 TonB-dependent receptor [Helicobacter saguini]